MKLPKTSDPPARSAVPVQRRLSYRLNVIATNLAQHMLRHVQREYDLNLAEYRVLTVLAGFEAPSIRDIAKNTQLDKAHVTRALAALIERGLASQTVDARDRRLRAVRLTASGKAIMSAMDPFVAGRQKRLERCLAPGELRVLDKALALLSAESERMLGEIQSAPPRNK